MDKFFVEWDETYSVENKEIDDQHKVLFRIINEISECLEQNEKETDCIVKRVVKELIDYTDYHFRLEEEIMEKMGYPQLNEHRIQHELFEAKVQSFKEQVNIFGATQISKMLLNYVAGWLKTHILVLDGDYAAFNKNK